MTERWCKLYPHALTDPMWLAVADDAGTAPGLVGATFVELLTWTTEHAPDTGSIAGFDPRVWAAWLRIAPEAVERIMASLRKFGRIIGDTIVNWAKRQGTAVVAAIARKVSTPRTRKHRERQRQIEMLLPLAGTPGTPDGNTGTRSGNTEERRERERSSESDSQDSNKDDAGVSRRCAPLERPPPDEIRIKRANLIKTLRRWARLSSHLDEDARLPRLQMLDRAELALADWDSRSIEDKRCFDILAARARASPLDDQVILWVRRAEAPQPRTAGGLRPLGYVLNGGRNGYPEPEISQMQRS
jgi:hypothetical protein